MPGVTEASKDNNVDDNQVDALENSTSKNQIHCKNCDDNIQCSECVVREWNAKPSTIVKVCFVLSLPCMGAA